MVSEAGWLLLTEREGLEHGRVYEEGSVNVFYFFYFLKNVLT